MIAPLRGTLIVAGILQALITLIQLAPFVLLTELARRMLDGATESELWTIGLWAVWLMGIGTVLAAALTLWLHSVDARFERDLRQQLLGKLAKLPLGWFTARDSGQVKRLVQDDTLSLHYLVTHAVTDAVAAVIAPVAVLIYLFAVDWRLALLMFVPILVYIVTMTVMLVQSGNKTAQAMRWADRMGSEAGAYLEGQPVIRVFGGAAASTFRARLWEYIEFLDGWQRPFSGKKSLMDLATRPATFLLLITQPVPRSSPRAVWSPPRCFRSCSWAPRSVPGYSDSDTVSAACVTGCSRRAGSASSSTNPNSAPRRRAPQRRGLPPLPSISTVSGSRTGSAHP